MCVVTKLPKIMCQYVQELRLIFPNAQRLNRGNYVMSQLVQACVANDVTDLIIIHEHRGDPGILIMNEVPFGLPHD